MKDDALFRRLRRRALTRGLDLFKRFDGYYLADIRTEATLLAGSTLAEVEKALR